MQSGLSIFKIGALALLLRLKRVCPDMISISSAYEQEFGRKYTSAIPTNVFGQHDNLYDT